MRSWVEFERLARERPRELHREAERYRASRSSGGKKPAEAPAAAHAATKGSAFRASLPDRAQPAGIRLLQAPETASRSARASRAERLLQRSQAFRDSSPNARAARPT